MTLGQGSGGGITPGKITVIGLGPAGPDLLTAGAIEAIDRIAHRYLRTTRHPAAPAAEPATSFDRHYEAAATIDEVYRRIVEDLITAASEHREVLYAVPGSPAVSERTVEMLLAEGRVDVSVMPALSFLDLAWARLGVDPFTHGVRVVDGHRFAAEAAGERGPLLVAQCDSAETLSEIKLAFDEQVPPKVVVLQRLGLPEEVITAVSWDDLDRAEVFEPDHLTSLWIPALAAPVATELVTLDEVVRRLRNECPWDRQQTHESLTRYLIEETYELVEAIESGEIDHLVEELGDVLLQVFLHTAIAAQAGEFTLADVARAITEKMVRRHPHVFGEVEVADVDEVRRNWETIKVEEKGRASVLDGVPGSLPALAYAAKLSKRAASVGFDWRSLEPVLAKVEEELGELRADPTAEELGDLLFAVVNVANHLGHDPEAALRGASAKFRERFTIVEREAATAGLDLARADGAEIDALWEAAKARLA